MATMVGLLMLSKLVCVAKRVMHAVTMDSSMLHVFASASD